MRDLDPGTTRFLAVAQEITRSRNGDVCEPRDLAIAYALRQITAPDFNGMPVGAWESTSPDQVRLGPEIEAVLTLETDEPVVLGELLAVAESAGQGFADYLGVA